MKLEQIIASIAKEHEDKPRAAIRSVASDIYYGGEHEEILANDALMDRLFLKFEQKEKIRAHKVAAESPDVCPICKMATATIMLAKDKPAKWCNKHFVVFPVRGS